MLATEETFGIAKPEKSYISNNQRRLIDDMAVISTRTAELSLKNLLSHISSSHLIPGNQRQHLFETSIADK
jgi:hypothetical protein